MPAYCGKDGRWRYQKYLVIDSRAHRISGSAPKKQNTKAAAERAEREHIARLYNPTPSGPSGGGSPTFKEWSETYMEHGTAKQSPSEIKGKRQKLKALLVPMLGKTRIDQIGRLDLDRVRSALKARTPSTINNYLSTVGAILTYAVDCKKLQAAPDLGLLNIPKQPYEWYPENELLGLLEDARGDVMMTAALLLGCDAGLRAGEIRALHRDNIGRGKLVVMFSDYEGELKTPKSGEPRTVPMTPRLAAAVDAALAAHDGPRVLARLAGFGQHTKSVGLPWTKYFMTRHQPPKGWHALRHSFCTLLAAAGRPAREIQALAGHASITTTERYMHHAPDRLAASVLVLDPAARAQAMQAPALALVPEVGRLEVAVAVTAAEISVEEARARIKAAQDESRREYQRNLMRRRRAEKKNAPPVAAEGA